MQVLGFVGWLVVCFTAGGIGAVASSDAGTFYSQLERPPWAPPAWVFGPVWSVLYLTMAISAWLVWRTASNRPEKTRALGLFAAQLVANALWSWLFFAWHQGAAALAEVALLWLLIAWTAAAFSRIKPLAGLLLVPYLLWVSFASVLNLVLWRANPNLLG